MLYLLFSFWLPVGLLCFV